MTAHAKHKFRLLKWGRMVRDCSWLQKWKRPRVARFEIHRIVTSFSSWIKDAMVVFSRYNIYLVSSNHKKRPTRTERPCVFQSTMCFNVLYVIRSIVTWTTWIPQSNLENPHLDYPDFSIIQTFSLVPILLLIFISHDQDPWSYGETSEDSY